MKGSLLHHVTSTIYVSGKCFGRIFFFGHIFKNQYDTFLYDLFYNPTMTHVLIYFGQFNPFG